MYHTVTLCSTDGQLQSYSCCTLKGQWTSRRQSVSNGICQTPPWWSKDAIVANHLVVSKLTDTLDIIEGSRSPPPQSHSEDVTGLSAVSPVWKDLVLSMRGSIWASLGYLGKAFHSFAHSVVRFILQAALRVAMLLGSGLWFTWTTRTWIGANTPLEPVWCPKICGMFQNCDRIETSQFYHCFET